jgi:hypothetical protein
VLVVEACFAVVVELELVVEAYFAVVVALELVILD